MKHSPDDAKRTAFLLALVSTFTMGLLDGAGLRADWNISVTPDLKYYAYSLTQATSELYVMEDTK